jgi:pyridoxal phosphate enzyme (YggS family)
MEIGAKMSLEKTEGDSIALRITEVQNTITQAAERVGKDALTVTLVAVSKTQPIPALLAAYQAGIRDFGENRVQEFLEKYDEMPPDVRWHLIGHLQTNKVKYVVGKVAMIHSVDSYDLAKEISKQALKKGISVDILIEVNVAEEESKFGVVPMHTQTLIRDISKLPQIVVKGLMTVAPYVTDPEDNRKVFSQLAQMAVDIEEQNYDNVFMNELSMGMTGDYSIAVEEGATIVRVGTGIFGER